MSIFLYFDPKINSLINNIIGLQGDSKAQAWLDGLLKIPFNQYCENEIMCFKKKFINKLPIKL